MINKDRKLKTKIYIHASPKIIILIILHHFYSIVNELRKFGRIDTSSTGFALFVELVRIAEKFVKVSQVLQMMSHYDVGIIPTLIWT